MTTQALKNRVAEFKADINRALNLENCTYGWRPSNYQRAFKAAVKESILQRGWHNTLDLIYLAEQEGLIDHARKVYSKMQKLKI